MGKYLDIVAEIEARKAAEGEAEFGRFGRSLVVATLRPNSEAEISTNRDTYTTSSVVRSFMSYVAPVREEGEKAAFSSPPYDRTTETTKLPKAAESLRKPRGQANDQTTTKLPALLGDGRRVWRFRAEVRIPRGPSPHLLPLIEYAREFGAVLVADGAVLIVVEPWLSNLPPETLHNLRAEAAGIIACLRGPRREPKRRHPAPENAPTEE